MGELWMTFPCDAQGLGQSEMTIESYKAFNLASADLSVKNHYLLKLAK